MKVSIDSREQKRIKEASKYYTTHNLNVTVEELPIADYVFNDKVYFEYKTIPDFINSVQSDRIFNQAIELSTTPYHFIIIVGTEKEKNQEIDNTIFNPQRPSFSKAQYLGAKCRLNTITTVIECNDLYEAFNTMHKQTLKCLDNKLPLPRKKTKITNPCTHYLAGIPRISNEEAHRITTILKINNLTDLLQVNYNDLINIKNVGDKKATRIIKAIQGE